MSEQLTQDIERAIEAHLPAATAGLLRKRLDQLERLEQAHQALQSTHEATLAHNQRMALQESGYKTKIEDLRKQLDKYRERETAIREGEWKIREAELRQQAAENTLSEMRTFTGMVFRVPEIRRQVTRNESTSVPSPACGGYQSTSATTTETVSET